MPSIFIKEYEWSETLEAINIIVPVPGISAKNVDTFLTDSYTKISCAPYIWEIFFKHDVDSENCVVKIESGAAKIRLSKKESILWSEIAQVLPDDKKSIIEKRQEEICKQQKKQSERSEKLKVKKQTWNRSAIDEQIKLDEEEKQRIKDAMTKDKLEAMKLMFSTTTHSKPISKNDVSVSVSSRRLPPPPPRNSGKIVLEFTEGKNDVPTRECWDYTPK